MKIGILTNGSILDYDFYKAKLKDYDLMVCADGGLTHAYRMDLVPDVALGDFDSTSPELVEHYRSKGCKIIPYSTIKNETDTEIALNYTLGQGPDEIDILAGIGSRFDHSLANVHLLKKALERQVLTRIITENNEIMITDSKLEIRGAAGDGISLLPLTPTVRGVTTSGLAYPIKDGNFEIGAPYGVSNYMDEPKAWVEISSGLLLVIKYCD